MIVRDMSMLKQIAQKTTVGVVLISTLAFGAAPAFAAVPLRGLRDNEATESTANQTALMTNLKNRADNAITARVNSLNKLITIINNIKRLTAEQKTTLTTQVQTEITNLQTLKSKIDADTDLTTLRTDVKSIVQSFRVYLVFIPKTYIIAHGDRILDVVSLLQTLETKLTARVSQAGNPSNLMSLLTDMTNKLNDASAQANNAINAVLPLTPDGWPGNKTTLQSARTMLQTARHDLQDALHDAQSIRRGLKGTGTTPTPTP